MLYSKAFENKPVICFAFTATLFCGRISLAWLVTRAPFAVASFSSFDPLAAVIGEALLLLLLLFFFIRLNCLIFLCVGLFLVDSRSGLLGIQFCRVRVKLALLMSFFILFFFSFKLSTFT